MTTVNSVSEVHEQMSEAAAHIRGLLDELDQLAVDRVLAEEAYARAINRARIKYREERSDICKAMAEMDTEVEHLAFEQAKASEKRCKEALHSWRSILSGFQTLSTGYREEAKFARTYG